MKLEELCFVIVQHITMLAVSQGDKCEGVDGTVRLVNTTYGSITSSRYPNEHLRNQRCRWKFSDFSPEDILQISIKELLLGNAFALFSRSYLRLPNGAELEGDKENLCDLFGTYKSIGNCSENVKRLLKNCSYYKLEPYYIPPKIKFKTSRFRTSRGFSLTYKIWKCKEARREESESSSLPLMETHPAGIDATVIVPSVIAPLIFILALSVIAVFICFYRKNRPKISPERRIDNVYDVDEPHFGTSHTYDEISAPMPLNRSDMASYLSHSQLGPNAYEGYLTLDGYVDIDGRNRSRISSSAESLYTTMHVKSSEA